MDSYMPAGIPAAVSSMPNLVTLDTAPLKIPTSTKIILTTRSPDSLIPAYPALQSDHTAFTQPIFSGLFADPINALQTDC
jgi:hypothetical protein